MNKRKFKRGVIQFLKHSKQVVQGGDAYLGCAGGGESWDGV